MFSVLLSLHSIMRWVVLITLIVAIARAFAGWFNKKAYSKRDNSIKTSAVTAVHVQFLIGLILYFVSPTVTYFLNNFKAAVKERGVRFFAMEHSLMMLVAVILITIGSAMSRRRTADTQKFMIVAIWFTIGLVIILASIPWPGSPIIGRPYLRMP